MTEQPEQPEPSAPLPPKHSLVVDTADRIDKAVARHFPDAGRKQLARLFDDGAVKVKGKRAKKGDRVVPGDVIELAQTPLGDDALAPLPDPEAAARLVVLLERPEVIVVAKPAGMPSQPLRAGELGTAANAIAARYPECATISLSLRPNLVGPDLSASLAADPTQQRDRDPRDGGIVHRLDIGTSGALIAARTVGMYTALRAAFGTGLVEKHYLAIVEGRPVSRECIAPLAQRGKRAVVDETDGLAATTQFTVLNSSATHALVRCTGQTGRMHQVRAHLAHVGAPIVGDTLYGAAALPDDTGFFLHAERVTFPIGSERVTVTAPLPERFTAMLATTGLAVPT
ncbi:MAG: RluA family pseudouridine synthase [Deltaproteobacteria bacterium]|nr:RluA family pseudouridine synthase [Deltaproteobacteria bacterium]